MFTAEELLPIKLTLELALITTVFLLLVATPLAWWLSHTQSKWRAPISSIVTLPLVLPPSVLGFYLLVAMGPSGPLGKLTEALGIGLLTFTFPGLVIGSIVYSMPFAVQPVIPRSGSPWRKASRSRWMSFIFFLDMARRTMSACPREYPASRRKISMTCSW